MSQKRTATELLEGAYEIETPEDNLSYYADFARTYDTDFAAKLGYAYPAIIAEFYHKHAGPSDVPVADIGCGTGLVAQALNLPQSNIDGFDISPHMLAKARDKNIYANLHRADLTSPLQTPQTPYGALVSAGTFTHGHLGPDPLENLLTLARTNALFCIGVNAQHFQSHDFASVIRRLENTGKISAVQIENVPIFSDPNSAHGKDTAQVLLFRKT